MRTLAQAMQGLKSRLAVSWDMLDTIHALSPATDVMKPTTARRLPASVLASPRYAAGSWRYYGCSNPRGTLIIAIFVSIGMHVMFLYGFNHKAKAVKAAAPVEEVIQIAMPDLKEDEPDKVEELGDSSDDQTPAIAVPQLADVPSSVSVNQFVQPLQVQPQIAENLNAAKVAKIPLSATRAQKIANLGKVFEISQLDRAPTPIAQPPPAFPYSLRQQVSEAKVTLEFIVDANGEVVAPMVTESSHHGFDEAAMVGVSKWKFRPGMKAGRKVNTRVRQVINFTIGDE